MDDTRRRREKPGGRTMPMKLSCAQCDAKIELVRDETFLSCPYCSSLLYADRGTTFLRYIMRPNVDQAQGRRRLIRHLSERSVHVPPLTSSTSLLLPFWLVRGEYLQETIPAFSPVPDPLVSYRIPPGQSNLFNEDAVTGYRRVEPAEVSSLAWQGHPDVSEYSLVYLPFHRFRYGQRDAYEAYVDALSGHVRAVVLPPVKPKNVSLLYTGGMTALFCIFAGLSWMLPRAGVSLAACLALAFGASPLVGRLFEERAR